MERPASEVEAGQPVADPHAPFGGQPAGAPVPAGPVIAGSAGAEPADVPGSVGVEPADVPGPAGGGPVVAVGPGLAGAPARAGRVGFGRRALAELVVILTAVALGGPVGLLWRAIAPRVELIKVADGWYPVEEEPEGFFADDGLFALLGVGAGGLLALAAWLLLRRYRGPFMVVALAAGCLVGAEVAEWVGHTIGLADYRELVRGAAQGTRVHRPAELGTDVVLLIQAAAAVGLYTLLAAFHYSPSLQPDDGPDVEFGDESGDEFGDGPEYPGADPAPADDSAPSVSSAPSVGSAPSVSSAPSGLQAPPVVPAPPAPGTAVPPPDRAAPTRPAAD